MNWRSGRGFTLIELVVGCALVGIVMLAAVPNLRSYRESQRMSMASEQLAAACRSAQARARAENHDVVLECRTDENAWAIVDDENGNGQADDGENVVVQPLGDGLLLSATTFPNDRLVFDSRGRATAGGNVLLRGRSGVRPKQVRVAAGTGHIRIRSGETSAD